MILTNNRTRLDADLQNRRITLLVLVGARNSKADEIHAFIQTQTFKPWRHTYLITDVTILTSDERSNWFAGFDTDRHAVLGGDPPKRVAQKGSIKKLLRVNKAPSVLKIRNAFAKGDEL